MFTKINGTLLEECKCGVGNVVKNSPEHQTFSKFRHLSQDQRKTSA